MEFPQAVDSELGLVSYAEWLLLNNLSLDYQVLFVLLRLFLYAVHCLQGGGVDLAKWAGWHLLLLRHVKEHLLLLLGHNIFFVEL